MSYQLLRALYRTTELGMARAIWKGAISFGLVHIPVSLQPAEKRHTLDLTMLDRRNMKPVGNQRINKESGEPVPYGEIVKGYEYEKEHYVVLTDEDFKRANVKATQTIDILNFIDAGGVPSLYFETPYYLVPERHGEKSYTLLRETLRQTKKIGIANVVLRTRQHLAALFPLEHVLVLNTLRYADEIRPLSGLELPEESLKTLRVNPREVEMATRLVEEMSEKWKPQQYHDTYTDDILARVEQKIKSGEIHAITPPAGGDGEQLPSAEVIDLVSLLKRSLKSESGVSQTKQKASGARNKRRHN
jgi:DNA end-binding protein Ku